MKDEIGFATCDLRIAKLKRIGTETFHSYIRIYSYFVPMSFTDKFDKEDYYLSDEGYIIFTEKYHLKRGYCCQSGCRHCPWKEKVAGGSSSKQKKQEKN